MTLEVFAFTYNTQQSLNLQCEQGCLLERDSKKMCSKWFERVLKVKDGNKRNSLPSGEVKE